MFSAGSTLGAARPQTCAKESSTLWTLFRGWPSGRVRFTRRGWVSAYTRRRRPGTRKDLTGSDKRKPHCGWTGGSSGIAMLPTRSIGDLPSFNLWFGKSSCIVRQQVEAALRLAGRVERYSDVANAFYRRLAKLQFMVWQVVLHCAAASVSGHCPPCPQRRRTARRSARRAARR